MAEFKISRFRYTWQGDWSAASVAYNRDDVVYHNGSAWVCIRQHTSAVFDDAQTYTAAGDTNPSPAWIKMAEGREWLGQWTGPGQRYDLDTLIVAGGNLYLCISSHLSAANFNSDLLKWDLLATGYNFRNAWAANQRYRVGDVIRYNGYTYQCILEHTSGSAAEGAGVGNNDADADSTAETWSTVVENYQYVGEWLALGIYRKNDLVKYGGSILKCLQDHSATTSFQNLNFQSYLPGFKFDRRWKSTEQYATGDVVSKGGTLYIAITNNNNSDPGISQSNWMTIDGAVSYTGEYDSQAMTRYSKGDLVRRGGALWISLVEQITDDSSLAIFDTSNWQLVISAYNFTGAWHDNTYYNQYDVVYFRGVVYYSNSPHISSYQDFPGDNGGDSNYWTIVIVSDENAALTYLGDLITYNLYRNVIQDGSTQYALGDGSSFGTTTIPIGTQDQLLVVENNNGDIGYKAWGHIPRVFYVRTDGVDSSLTDLTDPNRGISYFKPFKTIRFALEQADDGYAGFTSILVSTGEYQEVLPLILPARTAVVGEELRGVTVRANEPIAALANDAVYTLETLIRLGTILPNIVEGTTVSKSTGNLKIQDITVVASITESSIVGNLWGAIITVIDARVNDNGSSPAVTGNNTATTNAGRLSAITILENNREFIKAEAIAYMAQENPTYSFNTDKCRRDVDRFIDAVQYDLQYPGNYKSVLAGRYYANAVTGSALEDMWYVRDSSGLRNMTWKGLEGSLPALQAGEIYRIPTGGAFVSLDPGWGPADERTWVTSRSCYVQNVTTFGTGAIGQKVDGSLHNGGNKSIVSNDFTQVISDGIGAWMANGGRGELVSVFSYYAHIGMFATDGGTIRATNGNSSYGGFGAVADGLDASEVVQLGYLNTRLEQATVVSAFAGEILDFILGFEFSHMGQDYTTASYSITSSGSGATTIQEEFRDNAMFECQVLSAGAGFTQYGNQAQLGNETQIILASSETVEEADILGMRIIITSGEGTGQYGYVYSYSTVSKTCLVYRESDDLPGWDHINPGTPSAPLMTTGTRYRIEPRPRFSAPPYSATEITLSTSYAISAGVFGETSGTFTGITGTAGTGVTIDVTPAPAEFTVVKNGRSYSVTLTNGGAGYAVGNTITISGANIGGTSVEHDILITVTDISDDSTNSILSYRVTGIDVADSGKFILTPSDSATGLYSSDGDTWYTFTLPNTGNWKVTAGNNRFVAVMTDSQNAAYSTDGITWASSSLSSNRNWRGVAYGKPLGVSTGVFVAVSGNLNSGAYSTNGSTWASTTLPTVGDSTLCEWTDIAYGSGIFVALANEQNVVGIGTWNGTTLSWTSSIMDVVGDSSRKQWVSITYGNRRFVAISDTGDVSYSFDGATWYAATMPKQDGSTIHNWKQIRYGQGVFFAVGDTGGKTVGADPTAGPTTFSATSHDGVVWTSRTLATSLSWTVAVFGNPDTTLGDSTASNSKPTWILAGSAASDKLNKVYTGARALGRIMVAGQGVASIRLWEGGSGYIDVPTLELITCPAKTLDPTIRARIADGVLAQPTFIAKGVSYKTSTTVVTVSGDGFADKIPSTKFITLDGLTRIPGPGAQFYIGGRSTYFVAVDVGIDDVGLPDGTLRSTFQISPVPNLTDFLEHNMEVVIREKYSQVRITGHDFLDIGTGNFAETNYPVLYQDYEYVAQPFQEVYNLNGGRVFYTSTDQSGNFRAGELFAVEQATGIITISADFFDLAGLTELRLAGVRVGSTAVIREFSKDPLFLQNSNNIIPTQRAVRSYLNSRLNIGGEDLLTPSVVAGTVKVGPQEISNTAGITINIPVLADFRGPSSVNPGVSGSMLAQTMFFRSFSSE